jgi:hypothetical protein
MGASVGSSMGSSMGASVGSSMGASVGSSMGSSAGCSTAVSSTAGSSVFPPQATRANEPSSKTTISKYNLLFIKNLLRILIFEICVIDTDGI